MKKQEIDQLEQVDEMLLRNLFYLSRSVAKDLLHLEMVYLPISYIKRKERRHHILQQKEESLVFRFFMAQIKSPTPTHDWVSTVLEDLEELHINIEIGDIKDLKKGKFKAIVKETVTNGAFKYLIKKK